MIDSMSEIDKKWAKFHQIATNRLMGKSECSMFTDLYCVRARFAIVVEYCVSGLCVVNTL